MKNYLLTFLLAVLVVLTGVTLRRVLAASGTSPVPPLPKVLASGTSPVPPLPKVLQVR
jgi:hypothetical protein